MGTVLLRMDVRNILVTCPKGCSRYLRDELEGLGYTVEREVAAGVFTRGDMVDCMRLNLYLRTGLRVLWEVGNFAARDGEALYRRAIRMPWEDWIPSNGYVSIVSSIRNETIVNTQFANLKLKDALVDRIRDKTGERPDTGNDSSRAVVFLYWHETDVCVYLDTSGVPLSNRGYRVSPWKAPLRENLAASMIAAMRWDGKSPFVIPMCGSGTLAIEAALKAQGRPAGLMRENFAFMHLETFDERAFASLREEAAEVGMSQIDASIVASDIDPDAIEAAQRNAEIAGVAHLIDFEVCDFRETRVPEAESGVVALNPEYGERMGDERELFAVYKSIGDFFKKSCAGYWGYVFTGNIPLGKQVGLRPKRRVEFYNGPIECRLFEYELYAGTRDPRKQGLRQ